MGLFRPNDLLDWLPSDLHCSQRQAISAGENQSHFVGPVDFLVERHLVIVRYSLVVVEHKVVDRGFLVVDRLGAAFEHLLNLVEAQIAACCGARTCARQLAERLCCTAINHRITTARISSPCSCAQCLLVRQRGGSYLDLKHR